MTVLDLTIDIEARSGTRSAATEAASSSSRHLDPTRAAQSVLHKLQRQKLTAILEIIGSWTWKYASNELMLKSNIVFVSPNILGIILQHIRGKH